MSTAAMSIVDHRYDPLARVSGLLKEWVQYRKSWKPDIGLPGAVAWLDEVRGGVDGWTEGEDYDRRIYSNDMRHVDQAISNDLSSDHRHAIFVVYLNEAGPAVWRSARKPMSAIRALCLEAEIRLVPLLRRRDVAL